MIINQNALHLEVSLFTILLALEFDERVLEAIACPLVTDDFTGQDFAEAAENELEILVCQDQYRLGGNE
jgi:hypothetical protein